MARKPKFHWSHIDMLMRCPKQYEFRYVDGIIQPPSIPLHVGSSVHEVAATNLRAKVESGSLLPIAEVMQLTSDSMHNRWAQEGIYLSDVEVERGVDVVKGAAIDEAVGLSVQHYKNVAPHVRPLSAEHIERSFVVRTKKPYDIAGTFDVVEPFDFRDIKTSKQGIPQSEIDGSVQFSIYALAALLDPEIAKDKGRHTLDGEDGVVDVKIDILNKKTGKSKTVRTSRDKEAMQVALNIVDIYWQFVKSGVFPPSTNGWWCSARWCGWHNQCPFYTGRP